MLPEFFNLDVHFLFLLFDKFLSVKFFLPNNFNLKNYMSHKKYLNFFFRKRQKKF